MYWADYFADTTHFTTEMHGAYLLLIGAYWRRGRALPDDPAFLASAAKMTRRRFIAVRDTLSDKFVIVDGLLYHVRVEYELLRSCQRISSAQARANARWHAQDMQVTITTTKERRGAKRNRPPVNGVDALALSPERVAELQDKTDRILQRGKYAEKLT